MSQGWAGIGVLAGLSPWLGVAWGKHGLDVNTTHGSQSGAPWAVGERCSLQQVLLKGALSCAVRLHAHHTLPAVSWLPCSATLPGTSPHWFVPKAIISPLPAELQARRSAWAS